MVQMEATPAIDSFILCRKRILGRGREVVQQAGLDRLRRADQVRQGK